MKKAIVNITNYSAAEIGDLVISVITMGCKATVERIESPSIEGNDWEVFATIEGEHAGQFEDN